MLNLNKILDIKVTKKLTILLMTMVLGFVAIGLTYWIVIKNERESTERSNLFIKYGQLVSDAQKNYFKVRRYEKDFLLSISASTGQTYNNAPLAEHEKYMFLLEENMEQLRALSNSDEFKTSENIIINDIEMPAEYQSELVAQASDVVENYQSSFADIVKFNQVVGFTDIEGLRKKANVLLKSIESELRGTNSNNLQSSLEKIRASEKHILQSIDLTESFENLKQQLNIFQLRLPNTEGETSFDKAGIDNHIQNYIGVISDVVANKRNANEYTELFDFMLGPIFDEMGQSSALSIVQNQATQKSKTNSIVGLVALSLIAIASLVSFLLYLFGYTITKPINTLVNTIHEVNQGNLQARTSLARKDELGELSSAFDRLLDEKVTQLSLSEDNNNQLNESIISLLNSVAQLSKKDFTVKVPVHEDVTGALGDSLNFLTKETATALSDVKEISVRVVVESNRVQRQAKFIMAVAEKERQQVESIMNELNKSSNEIIKMSSYATNVNKQAEHALKNTFTALKTVEHSKSGIDSTRNTIKQTEKKIKRLGERSQEITGIVKLMNSIAERTHILALNASMHAASSGEKGRGYSVVAEEVQRLAESASEATTEIESLVNNIRTETKDAVSAMNTAITQVTNGATLAEKAGSDMRETQGSTQELVQAVNEIAKISKTQANAHLQLVKSANGILESTRKTDEHLRKQNTNTNNLVRYSNMLLTTVGIFKLPVVEQEDKLVNIPMDHVQNSDINFGVTTVKDVNLRPSARAKETERELETA